MGKKILSFVFSFLLVISTIGAHAGQKEFKLGVLFSTTGPFAPAGALPGFRGTMIAIDLVNQEGGIGGKYKIVPVVTDAQSNPDVALREAERLIKVEKVPVILGVYSSSIAVPLAAVCEKNKTIFWDIIAISDKVVKGRHQKYVFRPQPMGSQWGKSSVDFLKDNYEKLGYKSYKDIRLAIIYEDGPYGSSVEKSNKQRAKEYGMKVVFEEGYSVKAKDLSSLILKLKAARPDVILHTGYFPDIVLFLRQSRELGLKTKGIIGHGAGYANITGLSDAVGVEMANYLYNIDPAPAQKLDLNKLTPEAREAVKKFLAMYKKKYGDENPPTHATQGFGHTWIFLKKVLPLALKKYGDLTPDSIRKAALELDIPEGGTPNGYGVKFAPPEDDYAGQNIRSYPVVMQWVKGDVYIVWPEALKVREPLLPIPKDSPLAAR